MCLVWSVALYAAEIWTLMKVHIQLMEAFKMWKWWRMEKISWVDKISNEELLAKVKEVRQLKSYSRDITGLDIFWGISLLLDINHIIQKQIRGRPRGGKRKMQMLHAGKRWLCGSQMRSSKTDGVIERHVSKACSTAEYWSGRKRCWNY